MSRGEEVGILLLGLAAVGMGLRTIRRHEEVAIDEIGNVIATYRGPAALCHGLAVILDVLAIISLAAASLLGLGSALQSYLRHRPGFLIVLASLAGLAWSLALVFGAVEQRGTAWRLVASVPGRLLGLSLSILALLGLALGVCELVAPSQFDLLVQSFAGAVFPAMSGH